MFLNKLNSITGRDTDIVDKTLKKDLTTLQKEFQEAKETGSSNYLEKLRNLMLKEKKNFETEKPNIERDIEQSKNSNSYSLTREDLLFRALHSLKVDGHRKGADTIEFLGGILTRSGGEGSVYTYKGKDDTLYKKIIKKYNQIQYDQDKKKLTALSKYFVEGEKAINKAIQIRDNGSNRKLIVHGSGKLSPSKILAFNQLPGLTCPGKGDCFNWCFALSGMTSMPSQMNAYAENLGAAERDDFVEKINQQLKRTKPNPTTINGKKYNKVVRIHAYGDFHTPKYVNKWRQITSNPQNADTFFYAYTKSFYMKPMQDWMADIKNGKVKNVKIIQSEGSKFDDKIDRNQPHCRVFDSVDSLKKAKGKNGDAYVNCDKDDMTAANPKNTNIGIEKHGSTPCASGFCPYNKTTASCDGKVELPIIHCVDQIDMHHHMSPDQLRDLDDLGAHSTVSEHARSTFGKHMLKKRKTFKETVTSMYRIKV